MTRDEAGFLRLPSGRIEYRRVARGRERPVIVLLHEGLGCVALWKDFPERLAAATGCTVFAYSRFGYGASDAARLPRPLTYMHEEARVLSEVLDAADVGRCIPLGHSDGASIAVIHAGATRDQRIAGLALMAPHVFTEPHGLKSIAKAREAYERGELRERLGKYHGERVDHAFHGWSRAWLDDGFHAWNIEEYLPAIRAPALLIQGLEDEYGTLAQLEALERQRGGEETTVVLPGCRHSPHRDKPEETLDAVARFVGPLVDHGQNEDN